MSKILKIQGRVVPVLGNDIDTDRIIPARFLKEITFSRMGEYPFFDERFNADGSKKDHPFNEARFQGAKILLSNVNFGCGSSREHAPQSLVRWGIQAVIAESFAEIFAGNCVMLGTPALVASTSDIQKLAAIIEKDPSTEVAIDLETMKVKAGSFEFSVNTPESRRKALTEGTWDSTSLLMANASKVDALAKVLLHPNAKRA